MDTKCLVLVIHSFFVVSPPLTVELIFLFQFTWPHGSQNIWTNFTLLVCNYLKH